MPRRPTGLFLVLEKELKKAKKPVTCVDLWDSPEVREHAQSINRVSDYLGHLWRKGKARRFIAPKTENSEARYAYEWNWGSTVDVTSGEPVMLPSHAETATTSVRTLLQRPSVEIVEEGKQITITLPKLSIVIRQT